MAINTTTLEATIQSKIDSLSESSSFEDLLLIGKAIESSFGSITQSDLLETANTQMNLITATGNSYVDLISSTGEDNIDYITANGIAQIDAIIAEGNTQISLVSSIYQEYLSSLLVDPTITGNTIITGDLSVGGIITEYSDISLKENIRPLEDSLENILKMTGVKYNKIETPSIEEIGLIAQDVEKIYPELVVKNEFGLLTVSYSRIVAVLIEAIKELKIEIENLKK